ncbi:MAG: enoyl-CoA hydratase/isomerase family protein [Candidatus Poseidoniales archaeon]|jgi:2-(1,2-epoxy-1,2-dihydrophenyl)acetyl-CoA isomerase
MSTSTWDDLMPIETTIIDTVAIISMTGKTASNSFSREAIREIAEAIDVSLNNQEVRGIVITGEGKFFSAGADIKGFKRHIEDETITDFIHDLTGKLHPLILRMRRSPKILVAAINGAAAGGGLGLALACDARVAGPSAKLAASYAGIGLSPDGGTTWLLPRLVGDQVSRRFFLENQIWGPKEAHAYGAVDHHESEEELLPKAIEIAKQWSQWGNHTREATKHLIDVQTSQELDSHLNHERLLIEAAGTTADFREGVDAFLNKRPANFE